MLSVLLSSDEEVIPNGWLIGVTLGVAASIISNLGLNLQKKSHMKMAAAQEAEKKENQPPPITPRPPILSPYEAIRDNVPLHDDDHTSYQTLNDGTAPPPTTTTTTTTTTANGYSTFADKEPDEHKSDVSSDDDLSEYSESDIDSNDVDGTSESDVDDPALIDDLSHHFVGTSSLPTSSSYSAAANPVHLSKPRDRRIEVSISTNTTSSSSRLTSPSSSNLTSTSHTPHTPRTPRKNKIKNYTRYRMWQIGIACVAAGSLLDFAALAFAAQSIVAPLGSLTLVSNVILAPLLLKEQVTRRDIFCTIAIVVGSVISVAFASHNDVNYSIEELFSFFETIPFGVYAGVVTIAMIALRYGIYRVEKLKSSGQTHRYLQYLGFHCFAYAALAGIMGAQSVLMAKCTSQLFLLTVSGTGRVMFAYWQTYFILGGLIVSIVGQIKWLNSGLAAFDALSIVPIFQSFWILVSVIAGMIFFHEYHAVINHTVNLIMFPTGLAMTVAGVYVLSQKQKQSPKETTATSKTPLLGRHVSVASDSTSPIATDAISISYRDTSQHPSRTRLQPPVPYLSVSFVEPPAMTRANIYTTTSVMNGNGDVKKDTTTPATTTPSVIQTVPTRTRTIPTSTRIAVPPRHPRNHRERRSPVNNAVLTPLMANFSFLPPPSEHHTRRHRSHTHTARQIHSARSPPRERSETVTSPSTPPAPTATATSPPSALHIGENDPTLSRTTSKSAPSVTSPLHSAMDHPSNDLV